MQRSGLKRNDIDKFYTTSTIANMCVNIFKNNVNISATDLIIEPSAGGGAFIPFIKALATRCAFYDILPEHDEILERNYLALDHKQLEVKDQKIHIIGNPPFGRQSKTAIQFIKKSCQFADTISFILPRSFKKNSMKNKINKYFHLLHSEDLPSYSFLMNEEKYNAPCVFQIWMKREIAREEIKKELPIGYIFVKKEENPDISFRRVGVNAGVISTDIDNKAKQSHYFIKFTNNETLSANLERLRRNTFVLNNTIGPNSIAKTELIEMFNKNL